MSFESTDLDKTFHEQSKENSSIIDELKLHTFQYVLSFNDTCCNETYNFHADNRLYREIIHCLNLGLGAFP